MFYKRNETGYREPFAGARMKTLAWGDRTLMVEFHLSKGSKIPDHSHPHEQIGYLVSGRAVFTVDGEVFEATAGDGWCILGNQVHRVDVLEDSVVAEVFSPVREEYLP